MVLRVRAAAAAALVLGLAGCADDPADTAGEASYAYGAAEAEVTPTPTRTPVATPTPSPPPEVPDPTRWLHDGRLEIPESDPSTWPHDLAASPEVLASWRRGGDCAPYTLFLDYEAGILSPEKYTTYAMYAIAPYLLRNPSVNLVLPDRYVLCAGADAFELMGMTAGAYVEYLDPSFRDALWLAFMGETYTEAQRPVSDEELDEALDHFDRGEG